jgi:hypothetical protein
MNQSVYKRDFRDPRDIMRLWKFLLNENLESNLKHNDGDGKAAAGDCSINRREGEESYAQPSITDVVSRTKSELIFNNHREEKNLMKSKSLSSLQIPSVSSRLLNRSLVHFVNFTAIDCVPRKIQNLRFSHNHRPKCSRSTGCCVARKPHESHRISRCLQSHRQVDYQM